MHMRRLPTADRKKKLKENCADINRFKVFPFCVQINHNNINICMKFQSKIIGVKKGRTYRPRIKKAIPRYLPFARNRQPYIKSDSIVVY